MSERITLLDRLPETLSKPLAFIGGHVYVVTMHPVRLTKEHQKGKLTSTDTLLSVILRDDGVLFDTNGKDMKGSNRTLGLQVELEEMPPREKLLSAEAVRHYQDGYRPDPIEVFRRLKELFDWKIDFNKSLADQAFMTEYMACVTISTWFADIFNFFPYL